MTAKAKPAIGLIIFIGMISFVVAITMGGLIYMCKTKCEFQWCCTCQKNFPQVGVFVGKSKTFQTKCKFQCCKCKKSKSVEKEEENQDGEEEEDYEQD